MDDASPTPSSTPAAPMPRGLRAAREARALTLADLAERTRIPLHHLAAIEAGERAGLPRSTYLRFFLQTFRPIAEDLAGTAAFYLLYLLTGRAALAAGIGLALGLGQLGVYLLRRRWPPTLLLLGVALTAGLGGLTLVTADPRFLLLKPAIVYTAVALAMTPRGWVRRYVPAIALGLIAPRTFDRVGWGWAALMATTAVATVVLVATLPPRTAAGVLALGALASKLLLFGVQYAVLSRRARHEARNRGWT